MVCTTRGCFNIHRRQDAYNMPTLQNCPSDISFIFRSERRGNGQPISAEHLYAPHAPNLAAIRQHRITRVPVQLEVDSMLAPTAPESDAGSTFGVSQ